MSPRQSPARTRTLLSLVLAVVGGALSIWTVLDRGWVPFDEGTIAQAAERVLLGALPHRDFTDPYTGGLAFYHALGMRLFGVSLMAPRYAMFAAFALWLPAAWWLALRFCGRRWAVVITIIAAWWSLPIYPAAMPTWYLLFIGTWIVVALERWQASKPDGDLRWLVAVGALCGVAVLVKQTGLYLVAGALLGVLFCDQDDTRRRATGEESARHTDPVVVLLLASLGALVLKLLWGKIGSGELLHLVVPIGGLLSLAVLREWRLTDDRARRWRSLFRYAGVVAAAAAVPVLIFLLPYARSGAIGALYDGAIGEGVKRIAGLHWGMRSALTLLAAVWPVYAVLALEAFSRDRRVLRAVAIAGGVALLWFSIRSAEGYQRLWFFGTSVLPMAVGAVVVAGHRAWRARHAGGAKEAMVAKGASGAVDPVMLALASVTAVHALNQFPFSAPNYYAYVAPLAILTAGAAAAHFAVLPRLNVAALILAGFAGVILRLGSVHNVGFYPRWWDYAHRLAVPRGGILVTAYDSARYSRLLGLVAEHRAQGTVLAGPELPEVYFLSGSRSPGPDSYNLFAAPLGDSAQLSRRAEVSAASVIVIKARPMFLPPLRDDVYRWLEVRFPLSEAMDTLQVRWRSAP